MVTKRPNYLIFLYEPHFVTPTLGNVFIENNEGKRNGFALMVANLSGHGDMRIPQHHETAPRQTRAQTMLRAANTHPRLKAACDRFAKPNCSWSDLYYCLEELEAFCGDSVCKLKLCSEAERRRFKHTANSDAAGSEARHRNGYSSLPSNPMTLIEARTFISTLIQDCLLKAA
jgi:hypothetical protein